MIQLKNDNVNLDNVSSKIYFAISVVADIYEEYGYGDLTITSARDSRHSKSSLHYVGEGVDFRVWSVPPKKLEDLCDIIRDRLDDDYDVVNEKDHIHLEFDPK